MSNQTHSSPEDSEIVVGLVCAVGVNYKQCVHVIEAEFRKMGYVPRLVHLSGLMDTLAQQFELEPIKSGLSELERIRARMNMGNALREKTKKNDLIALSAIQQINSLRENNGPALGTVNILATLKRPEEVRALRRVYGAGFFLIGLHDSEAGRINYLVDNQGIDKVSAKRLMDDDQDDHKSAGQLTRETYYLSDVFVSLERKRYKEQISRFVELLFSHPYHTPTRDEYAMFMAFAASLKSAQLGRQVGASIVSEVGDVVALGCNDVPRPGGGQYWCEDSDDKRDHVLRRDTNDVQKKLILRDLLSRFGCDGQTDGEIEEKAKGSLLADITEFGRAMHAEMDALMSCVRNGITARNGILYTTTFPCHNCARHILGAGISRVVYIEPYAKSAALDLHFDGITVDKFNDNKKKSTAGSRGKIPFESFVGVGPRRYSDLFIMNPSYGLGIKRKRDGKTIPWPKDGKKPRLPMHVTSYLQREQLSVDEMKVLTAEGRRRNGDKSANSRISKVPAASRAKRS
ncbi:anti-phage dCTP deaminase [Edaphobacter albus]|uniref:anti-phage dCTP deaminase n=1 Tax=Edaphobacter sp. 4G125 TaxID=2763071 RepID=UPI0016475B72|nr:anti-phage dCTP deaminase [Edaphobacter sp. 4G125]QNI37804.1 cytidine deaminase [Edaphobacter sp. 4G125]